MSRGRLQLRVLRPLEEPLPDLVCDGALRQPGQDAQLSSSSAGPGSGLGRRAAPVVPARELQTLFLHETYQDPLLDNATCAVLPEPPEREYPTVELPTPPVSTLMLCVACPGRAPLLLHLMGALAPLLLQDRGLDAALGLISPVFADLSGLPPPIIQAGSHEVLLDDAVRLARQAATADVEVTLDITPRVPH